ncbi:MAG: tetratricopeptide repeat-containing sensor histidine kinase [Melioribacteraceae bacterium]|nr:tetratricopeptide repeat-containing sensor histidine kinase [Melioribacteraceae bacterium]
MKSFSKIVIFGLLFSIAMLGQEESIKTIRFVIDSVKTLRNNDPAYAILLGKKMMEEADAIGYKKGKADLLDEIGVNYKKLADYDQALFHHKEALAIYEELNDSLGIAFALSNIGNVYRQLKEFESALLFYNNSLEMKKALKDEFQVSYTLNKIGMVQSEIGEYATAVINFEEVIRINEKLKNINLIGSGYNNLGTLELQRGGYKKARNYLTKAYRIYNELDNTFGNAEILYKLAELSYKTKNYSKAVSQSKKSIKLAETISSKLILVDNYKLLSEIYAKLINHKEAFIYQQKLSDIKDSIFNEEKTTRLNQYKTLYQIKQTENENTLLKVENQSQKKDLDLEKSFRNWLILFLTLIAIVLSLVVIQFRLNKKKNVEISLQNKKLEKLNDEMREVNETKDKLISIIGHDIRNPFSSVLGFSDLLYQDYENLTEEDKKRYIFKIYSSSQNLYNLLENILAWSRAQKDRISVTKKELALYIIVDEVYCHIEHMFQEKEIELEKKFTRELTLQADIFMLSAVITNVLSNAIKFSKRQSKITIEAYSEKDFTKIIISDEGIGMSDEKAAQLFSGAVNKSEMGTDLEKGIGIGLMICKDFVQVHNGTIEVKSKINEGTSIIISFPNKIQ